MLSICPHLGDDTTHHGTPCTLPHRTLYIVPTRSRVHEYRGERRLRVASFSVYDF